MTNHIFGEREVAVMMNLMDAVTGTEYRIEQIETDDEELGSFLFSLGCYSGEFITVISRRKGGCVVSIRTGDITLTISSPRRFESRRALYE